MLQESTIYVVVAKEVGTTKLLSKWLYEVRNLTTYRSVVSSDAERCMEEWLIVTGNMLNIFVYVI